MQTDHRENSLTQTHTHTHARLRNSQRKDCPKKKISIWFICFIYLMDDSRNSEVIHHMKRDKEKNSFVEECVFLQFTWQQNAQLTMLYIFLVSEGNLCLSQQICASYRQNTKKYYQAGCKKFFGILSVNRVSVWCRSVCLRRESRLLGNPCSKWLMDSETKEGSRLWLC